MEASPTGDCGGSAGDHETGYCPLFQHAMELIGRRWTGSILKVLGDRSLRFSEIRNAIPGLSDRLLGDRLTELEAEGVVSRSEADGQVRYSATDKGLELEPILAAIGQWAGAHCGGQAHHNPGRRRS